MDNETPAATPQRAPACLKCAHFKITWEPAWPRSCLMFGIKSRNLPSFEVFRATGRHCPAFQDGRCGPAIGGSHGE